MKKLRSVEDLGANLTAAAVTPLVAPAQPAQATSAPAKKRAAAETQQMTLRPKTALVARYVDLAAERSKQLGRTVTAQQVMLEVLERGAA